VLDLVLVAEGRWVYRKEPADSPPRASSEKPAFHTYGFAKQKEAVTPRKE
jgi:hypothetical protein